MPLHDGTDRSGWEGMHMFWMTEIARAGGGGKPLPSVPLPINLDDSVMIDLEATYSRAAADGYLT